MFIICTGLYRCMSLRPPLQMECLTTPSPCTYNLPCSSLEARGTTRFGACPKHPRGEQYVTRSIHYVSIVTGILPYPSTGVWTTNVSAQDNQRPSPCSYRIATMGSKHPNKHNAPSYSMGGRTTYPLLIKRGKREQLEAILIALRLIGTEKEPAPNTYNIENVQLSTMNNSPAYSIALPAKTGQKGEAKTALDSMLLIQIILYRLIDSRSQSLSPGGHALLP